MSGSDQLPGKEHEHMAMVHRLCQEEAEADRVTQEQARVASQVKDGDRVKQVGDFQAKAEARERGQIEFDPEDSDDDTGIEELETPAVPVKKAADFPVKKVMIPNPNPAPPK